MRLPLDNKSPIFFDFLSAEEHPVTPSAIRRAIDFIAANPPAPVPRSS